jgi:hypothetical protein
VCLAIGSVLALAGPSSAASDAGDKTEPAKVEREAYFTAPANSAIPATLTNELPPGIVCILVPQVCGAQTAPVTDPLKQAISPITKTPTPDYSGQQPVEPGTLPVALLGGKARYTSYMKFPLPSIPAGSLIDKFELVLTETQVSYALESPAFRAALLAGLEAYETKDPATFVEYVGSVADQTNPLATTKLTGIELCAVTAPWAAGGSQDAAKQPPRDCIFGANGVRDAAAKTWTFDLTLLAQAWLDGTTPNEGVYLGPLGAENLAFGDPDTSTNWQVSLGGGTSAAPPKLVYAFSEGFGDESAGLEDLDSGLGSDDLGSSGDSLGSFDGFGGATLDPSVDVGSSSFDSLGGGTAAPITATAGGATTPRVSGGRARLIGESHPQSPWWLWLLLPLGLGAAFAFERSLAADPAVSRRGAGALTRLMATDDPPRS